MMKEKLKEVAGMKIRRSFRGQAGAESEGVLRLKEPSVWMQVAVYAVLCAAALLVPRATVYGGLAPFGVALAACVEGPASAVVYIAAAVGYILPSGVVMPLRYIAAIIAVAGFRWAFGGVKRITQSFSFTPLLAAGAIFATGLAVGQINGFQLSVVFSELCEAMLGGGAAFFFKSTLSILKSGRGPRSLELHEQCSLMVTTAVLLMAVDSVTFHDISVGRILTMTVILLAAKAGQQQGGMLGGVVLGSATALCMPAYTHVVAGYAFGGLIAGLFSRFGRLATVTVFFLVNALVLLSTGDHQLLILGTYEVLAASLLFVVLPKSVERAANSIFCRQTAIPAVENFGRAVDMHLTYAASTMEEIASTVDAVSQKLAAMDAPRIKEVYASVCEDICSGCRRREVCWRDRFTDTMAAFRRMGDELREKGQLSECSTGDFARECPHSGDVVSLMNTGYARFVTKENAYRRLGDIRAIVTDQFEGMAGLLMDLSDHFKTMDRADEQASERVRQLCERYRLPVVEVLCLVGHRNRVTVELMLEGDTVPPEGSRWHEEMGDACGCRFTAPTVSKNGHITKVRLTEKPKYTPHFAAAQVNCHKEKLCGDAYESFYDHEGRYCIVLSDGMGTGGRAAVDGAMTAALTGRMLQAGFRFDSILRIINSALIVKSGDESLATLDTVRIDLYTGHLQGVKAGAAPAFLYSRGQVVRLAASTLPIGILREIASEQYEDYMREGDFLVMVSDGVCEGDSEWLEELIDRLVREGADEHAMANEIVFRAGERQVPPCSDDTTALVLRLL